MLLFALRLCYIPWMTLQYSSVCVWNSVKYYMWSTPFGFPYMPCPAFTSPAVWCRVFQSRVFWPCIFDCPASSSLAFLSPPRSKKKKSTAQNVYGKRTDASGWWRLGQTRGIYAGWKMRIFTLAFSVTIRYDRIRDAILTCARKPI